MQQLVVGTEQPIRLDVWISGKLGQSRSQVQKLIKSGVVLVNGKARSPHFEVRERDQIEIKETIKQGNKALTPSVIASEPDATSGECGNLVFNLRKLSPLRRCKWSMTGIKKFYSDVIIGQL